MDSMLKLGLVCDGPVSPRSSTIWVPVGLRYEAEVAELENLGRPPTIQLGK